MIALCPEKADLVAFSQAQLDPDLAQAIAEHLDECPQCDQQIAALESEQLGRFANWVESERVEYPAQEWIPSRNRAIEALARLELGECFCDCRLIAELGAGAFGRVFLAEHLSMKRLVALKISTRKSQEPELLASLDHPHIVRVLHFDDRLANEGLYLLYMRYVPGCSLRQALNLLRSYPQPQWNGALLLRLIRQQQSQFGAPPIHASTAEIASLDWPSTVAWMGARLAHALDDAHKKGVFHRDIKPENILLDGDGRPFLIDFNVSVGTNQDDSTPEESFGGSLPYMAPEQLSVLATGEGLDRVGPEADVYALGTVLWEQLCGTRPFHETTWQASTTQLVAKRVSLAASNLEPPSLDIDLPRGFGHLLQTCLHPDAEKRPPCEMLSRQLHLFSLAALRPILLPKIPRWGSRIGMGALYLLAGELSIVLFVVLSIQHQLVATFGPQHGGGILRLMQTTAIVVSVSHGVGTLALLTYLGRPLRSVLRIRLELDRRASLAINARCLGAGIHISILVFLLWCFSAAVLLLSHDSIFPNVELTREMALRFLVPHLLYGIVSALTVGLFTTYATVRVLYPPLIPHCDQSHAREGARRVQTFLRASVFAIVLVPNIGLMLLLAHSLLDVTTGMTIGVVGSGGYLLAVFARDRILARLKEIDLVFAPFIKPSA